MEYYFTPQALRQIKKLPRSIQKRIIKKLDFYCQESPFVYADSLIDTRLGGYRFRIGSYRVVFDKEGEDAIRILKIGHRRDVYR
ncbi:type II toxin-antitoxin system RelE/ParE family toxin [Patescibacteria group bacterium]